MLTILFYIYTLITSCVVSAAVVSMYMVLFKGKTSKSVHASSTPEKILRFKDNIKEMQSEYLNLSKSQQTAVNFGLFFVFILALVISSLVWWLRPVLRLKMLKDVLTNNWAKL